MRLPPVEVVGVSPLPGLDLPLSQIPANVQHFGSGPIGRSSTGTAAEFLDQRATSVTTHSASGNPFQTDLDYRGFSASPLLGTPQGLSVFVDGVRVNEIFGDVVNWDLVPMSALASVALVPGSNPVYGLNTLGGALVLDTRNGSTAPGTQASVTGGSFGRRALALEHGSSSGAFDAFVTGNLLHEPGWREHSDTRLEQAFAKLRWRGTRTSAEVTSTLADNRMEGTQALPLAMLDNPRQAYTWPDITRNRLAAFSARLRRSVANSDFTVQGYARDLHNESLNSNVNAPDESDPNAAVAANVRSSTHSSTWGASLQWSGTAAGFAGRHRFTAGAAGDFGATDFDQLQTPAVITDVREIVDAGAARRTTAAHTRTSQSGLYALDSIAVDERTTVMASARYQEARLRIDDRSGVAPGLAGTHRFSRINPAIGATLAPSPATSLYMAWSQGMRVPTAMELTCADPGAPCSLPNIFVADPPLKAVIATTIEAGMRQRLAGAGNLTFAVYRSRLRDDIQFIATAAGTGNSGYFTNVGTTERVGAELGANVTLGAVQLDGRYAWTRATFRSAFVANSPANAAADANGTINVAPGDVMPGVPAHILKLRVGWTARQGLELGAAFSVASVQFARGNENNADPAGRVAGHAVLDLDLRWNPAPRWEIVATVANVLDRRYATFGTLGFDLFRGEGGTYAPAAAQAAPFFGPAAPRAAWVTLRHTFGAS